MVVVVPGVVVQTFQEKAVKPVCPSWRIEVACIGEKGVRKLRRCGFVLLFLFRVRPRSLCLAFKDLHLVPYLRLSFFIKPLVTYRPLFILPRWPRLILTPRFSATLLTHSP